MKDEAVARRYAQALLAQAQEQKCADAVQDDLQKLLPAMRDPLWNRFFLSPRSGWTQKEAALRKLLTRQVSPLVIHFILVMMRHGRMVHLAGAIEAYRILWETSLGRAEVHVMSAADLAPKAQSKLTQVLGERLNLKVQLSVSVDPALIGGFVVRLGNRVLDASVRERLNKVARHLARVPVGGM